MPKYKVPINIQKIAQSAIDYNLSFPLAQRAAYKDRNQSEMGIGTDTSAMFTGFNADDILNTSVEILNSLDLTSESGNPDFISSIDFQIG